MKNRDLIYAAIGIGAMALILLFVARQNQPQELTIDLGPERKLGDAHQMVADALMDIDSAAAQQDSATRSGPSGYAASDAPLPVAGEPLPVAWESKPAPEASHVGLSPSLERSLAASAELRQERYTNPSSPHNLQQIETLRSIRQERQQ